MMTTYLYDVTVCLLEWQPRPFKSCSIKCVSGKDPIGTWGLDHRFISSLRWKHELYFRYLMEYRLAPIFVALL